jgi:hypothetical protein
MSVVMSGLAMAIAHAGPLNLVSVRVPNRYCECVTDCVKTDTAEPFPVPGATGNAPIPLRYFELRKPGAPTEAFYTDSSQIDLPTLPLLTAHPCIAALSTYPVRYGKAMELSSPIGDWKATLTQCVHLFGERVSV